MKLKHFLLAFLTIMLCIVIINIAPDADAAPAKPSLSLAKRSYDTGVSVTFTINATGNDATNLWVYRVDGEWQYTYTNVGSSYSVTFGWAGYYKALVQTWNTDGTNAISDYIYFYIGAPTSVNISGNRAVVAQGQSISYTITSDDPGSVHVFHIYDDDANLTYHEYWTGITGTSYTFNGKNKAGANLSPGNYYAQVYSANDVNGTNSNKVWFTVVGGSASSTLSCNVTSAAITHGNITYTIKVNNAVNGSVYRASFKVVASNGSESHTLCTVTDGSISNGTASTASGSIGTIGKGSSASFTLTVDTANSAFDRNSTYTVQIQAGDVELTGLDAGNNTSIAMSASGTHQFKTTSGSATLSWSPSIATDKVVKGTYTYTVTFKNGTNHSINSIDYTVKVGSTAIVTVSNGTVTANHNCATVSPTSFGTVTSGNSVTLTITIDTSKLTAGSTYKFDLANGGCSATGISGGSSTYAVSTSGTGTHTIIVASGSATLSWASNATTNTVVKGTYTYTVTFKNGTNHSITGIDYTVKIGNTAIVTVTDGAITANHNCATVSVNSFGTITAGNSATLTITIDTSKLTAGSTYKFDLANGSCNATGTVGSTTAVTTSGSGSHTITVANGTAALSWISNVTSGKIVEGTYTYTITFSNNTNHAITGIDYTVKFGSTAVVTVTDGAVTANHNCASVSTTNLGNVAAGQSVSLTITIDATKLTDGSTYKFDLANGSCNANGVNGSGSGYAVSTSGSGSHTIIVRSGGVTMTWTPSISSGKVVEGTYTYKVTFTNNTNHAITGIDYTIKYGNTTVLSVSNGAVTASGCATANKTSLGDLASGASVELLVTIDTTKLTDGSGYTFTLSGGSSNATGIAGSNASIELKPTTNSYDHSITVRSGDVTVTLSSTTVNNNGVGEGDVNYTITLKNETNHTLTNIAFALKDSKGNTLLTVAADGTITVVNNTLVKNGGSVSGSLSALTAGSTVTISGVVIDGKADILDADGYLTLVATGTANASDVVGSGAGLGYDDNSDTFTIMVRHDVNLIVQSGLNTTINADKILAALNKSGATIYDGISGISAVTVTDINGNTVTITGFGSNGSNLNVNLTNAYNEFIIKVVYNGGSILVPIQVTTVSGGSDKNMVLDYSLPVAIDKNTILDDVRLTGGAYSTAAHSVIGFSTAIGDAANLNFAGKFGNFSFADNTFGYETVKFLYDEDAAYIVIRVGNTGTENVDYVNVYKRLSFIPSNVVYYEDTLIGSIIYPNGFTLDALGELTGTGVSAEQDMPETGQMGYDDGAYAKDTDVTISGESVQKVPVYDQQVTVRFTFTGTGFELISRVNAYDAATILVKVRPQGGSDADWTYYPVVTKFDPSGNGNTEVYQVPVFRLNETAYGTYEVEVVGLPMGDYDENGNSTGFTTSYIYIDGIRVYNPLGNSQLTEHYGVEKDAQFINLRDLILNGKGMVAEYTDSVTSFTTGSYYYVPDDITGFSAAIGSINELGAIGANNEILVRQSAGNHIVVLKVKDNGNGLLQIGIHDIHDAKFDGIDGENQSTTVSYKTEGGWVKLVNGTLSGTEQYYNIDLSSCPADGNYKIVILKVDSGFASFTNLKYKNVEFGKTGAEVPEIFTESDYYFNENGDMCKVEDGVEVVYKYADEVININKLNGILSEVE